MCDPTKYRNSRKFRHISYFCLEYTRKRTHSEERTGSDDRCHGQTSYVTGPIFKTSSLPRSCLSLASGAYASGHVRSESSCPPPPVCPRGLPICSKIFSDFPYSRADNRTIQGTFAERQKERNEARAKASGKSSWKNRERQSGEIGEGEYDLRG